MRVTGWCAKAVLAAMLAASWGQAAESSPPDLRLGYDLVVWKGIRPLGSRVGTVSLELKGDAFEGTPCRTLRVRTRAKAIGMDVDALTESYLTPDLSRELGFHYVRAGGEQVESRLAFGPSEIEYHKRVHCDLGKTCPNPEHQVPTFWGFLTGRTRHCPGCGRPEHKDWRLLGRHRADPQVCDMFAALYLAKADGLTVGGPPRKTRCVADLKLWDIAFQAVARERIEVPAGTFDTVKVELAPSPANVFTATQEFRGPFALGPDTKLWIDPARRLVVKVAGTAHLAIALQAEMRLATLSGAE